MARRGEPFKFGWSPAELPGWFSTRGFDAEWDRDMAELARGLLPPAYDREVKERASRIVLLRSARLTSPAGAPSEDGSAS